MTKEEAINTLIKNEVDTNKISDGYHTFGELYEHRITLFIALCRVLSEIRALHSEEIGADLVWISKKHSDGSEWDGWFIMGIGEEKGKQITYHLPISKWAECQFAVILEKAPDWDGHGSKDVLERIKKIL
jgi:hypothetical protein